MDKIIEELLTKEKNGKINDLIRYHEEEIEFLKRRQLLNEELKRMMRNLKTMGQKYTDTNGTEMIVYDDFSEVALSNDLFIYHSKLLEEAIKDTKISYTWETSEDINHLYHWVEVFRMPYNDFLLINNCIKEMKESNKKTI